MRILFEITHPAHVHLFRNAIRELAPAHEVFVTSRKKDVTTELLDNYGIEHHPISSKSNDGFGTIGEWAVREVRLAKVALRFDPDVIVSRFNPAVAHVSRLVGCKYLMLDDTESKPSIVQTLTYPLADVVLTPECFTLDIGDNQVRYDGYHELAYLHPNRFTADEEQLRAYGVKPDEEYYVIRTIAWDAFHDYGKTGLTPEGLEEIVSILDERGDVYITGETALPDRFEPYKLRVPPHLVHDLLAYADGYIGDSGTMAAEAAVLGTPAIRADPFAAAEENGIFVELEEKYGLLFSTADEREAIRELRNRVTDPGLAKRHERRLEKLYEEKIDVTAYLLAQIAAIGGEPEREAVA